MHVYTAGQICSRLFEIFNGVCKRIIDSKQLPPPSQNTLHGAVKIGIQAGYIDFARSKRCSTTHFDTKPFFVSYAEVLKVTIKSMTCKMVTFGFMFKNTGRESTMKFKTDVCTFFIVKLVVQQNKCFEIAVEEFVSESIYPCFFTF